MHHCHGSRKRRHSARTASASSSAPVLASAKASKSSTRHGRWLSLVRACTTAKGCSGIVGDLSTRCSAQRESKRVAALWPCFSCPTPGGVQPRPASSVSSLPQQRALLTSTQTPVDSSAASAPPVRSLNSAAAAPPHRPPLGTSPVLTRFGTAARTRWRPSRRCWRPARPARVGENIPRRRFPKGRVQS